MTTWFNIFGIVLRLTWVSLQRSKTEANFSGSNLSALEKSVRSLNKKSFFYQGFNPKLRKYKNRYFLETFEQLEINNKKQKTVRGRRWVLKFQFLIRIFYDSFIVFYTIRMLLITQIIIEKKFSIISYIYHEKKDNK